MENAQRRATKKVSDMRDLTYHERLNNLGLPTFEYRRERADLIQMFNISTKIDNLDTSKMFSNQASNTRGHPFKIPRNSSD